MLARGVHQPHDVFGNGLVDIDLFDGGLHLAQLLEAEHLLHLGERMPSLLLVQDHELLNGLRVAQA